MAIADMYFLGFFSIFPHKAYPFFLPLPKIPNTIDSKYKFNANIFFCQHKNAK